MAEMSRRFNFDDFNEQIREALEDNDQEMAKLAVRGLVAVPDKLREFQTPIVTEIPRPGPDDAA